MWSKDNLLQHPWQGVATHTMQQHPPTKVIGLNLFLSSPPSFLAREAREVQIHSTNCLTFSKWVYSQSGHNFITPLQ